MADWIEEFRVINASGTMTSLGSSSVPTEVITAMAEVLPEFVDIARLQRKASDVICRVTGAQAGCIVSCSSAAIAIGVAACLVGDNLARAERLPLDVGCRNEVILQKGHSVWFGGALPQMIRLAGARVVEIGHATRAGVYQLRNVLTETTACAVYVISHHATPYGMIELDEFVRVCHERGVPVLVDAASESAMQEIVQSKADLVCFSGHKFLQGPTSGILAGRPELVRACLVHSLHGIGRAMKVGKEGIVGTIVALERWERLNKSRVRGKQKEVLDAYTSLLLGISKLGLQLVEDPTGNPIQRLRVSIDPKDAGLTAFQVAEELKLLHPPIYVRDDEIDLGYFELDPCNLTINEAKTVGGAIRRIMEADESEKESIRNRFAMPPNVADMLYRSLGGDDQDAQAMPS